jgi:hypothetical protein
MLNPNPTLQEVFDHVLISLRKQKFASIIKETRSRAPGSPDESTFKCMYRGENNAKCAFGHCIPDSMYDRKLEGMSVNSLVRAGSLPDLDWIRNSAMTPLLMALQRVHDSHMPRQNYAGEVEDVRSMKSWEYSMQATALTHKLVYQPVTKEQQ